MVVPATSDESLIMAECTKNKNKVQDIFESMEYGINCETTKLAYEWLEKKEKTFGLHANKPLEQPNGSFTLILSPVNKNSLCTIHVPDIDFVKQILDKDIGKKWLELDPFSRTKIIYKIGTEIEKNAELFIQLDILIRGILRKDSAKAISCLAQYFHYYSNFAYSEDDSKVKPLGLAVGLISNENYLAHLGQFMAPALAAGCNIVLQVGTALTPIAFLLQEIAQKAGLPEGVFRIVPSDSRELAPYLNCDKVEIVTLFVDLNNEKYRGINTSNKKILHLTTYRTPVIIFDSADLDAACDGVIDSSWSYLSMLPWTTDTVLVQENVLPAFVNKLKSKMRSLEVAAADNKSARVSVNANNPTAKETLNALEKRAKLQGIEMFRARDDADEWSPALFIGGKVDHDVLSSVYDEAKAVTVLAFRSIDEAVNLANNTRQGLWASVWSENIGVVTEAVRKLKVSNISINGAYGMSPDVVLTPMKESGTGNFGGREGFLEYLSSNKTGHCYCSKSTSTTTANADSLVNIAKKAQEGWQKLSKIQKRKIFQQFAENLQLLTGDANRKTTWTLKDVYGAMAGAQSNNATSTISGYNLTSIREPKGVVVVDRSESGNALLILTALFEGNALIVLAAEKTPDPALDLLVGKLPAGVAQSVPYDPSLLRKLADNKKVDCYFGDDCDGVFRCLPLRDSKRCVAVAKRAEDVHGKVASVKNIWSDIGKSSTCTF